MASLCLAPLRLIAIAFRKRWNRR